MKMGKVDVIIPIYNSLDWLKICIEGVLKNTKQSVLGKIYLINDCSKEETTNYLNNLDTYNGLIEVIHNKKNLGFVKTCNYGMKISKSDYVLLLNTDCIVSEGAIEKMANAMSKDKKIGLLCPISSVASNLSYPIPAGMNFMQVNKVFEKQFKGKTFDACTVVGNCLMISRENINKVGFFDEIFGKGYTEETDYQFKSMKKGFKAKVLIDTYVYHQCRVTFGESEEQLKIRADHLKIFFDRWGKEYSKLMEKYQKNNPIDYINNHVDYSNVEYDYTIKENKDFAAVANITNKMMLEGVNIKVITKKQVIDDYKGITLFNPVEKKGLF